MPDISQFPSEEDFGLILDALDSYLRESQMFIQAQEAAFAAMRASKNLDPDDVEGQFLEALTLKEYDRDKVSDRANKLRDRIILLKAKVVTTKEHILREGLSNEIGRLTNS